MTKKGKEYICEDDACGHEWSESDKGLTLEQSEGEVCPKCLDIQSAAFPQEDFMDDDSDDYKENPNHDDAD